MWRLLQRTTRKLSLTEEGAVFYARCKDLLANGGRPGGAVFGWRHLSHGGATRVVRLIKKWLHAGVLEGGKIERSELGTVQGGSISPLLANIYLHGSSLISVGSNTGRHEVELAAEEQDASAEVIDGIHFRDRHPGGAGHRAKGNKHVLGLREGPTESTRVVRSLLCVQGLGITGALYRTPRTTNPTENLNGSIGHYTRNVKRWKDGAMTLRWWRRAAGQQPLRKPNEAMGPRSKNLALHREPIGRRAGCGRDEPAVIGQAQGA